MCDNKINVLLFGAGARGKIAYKYLVKKGKHTILAFIDNNDKIIGDYIESVFIDSPKNISNYKYDKIVITVLNENLIIEIVQQLNNLGIQNDNIEILAHTDFNPYDEDSNARVNWLRDFARYVYKCNIFGNVAECGVYRGDFARYVNKYFSDRKLYLFDTFQGFSNSDLIIERSFYDNSFLQSQFSKKDDIFHNTSVDVVMRYMPYKENCIIKQGYFPDTATGIEDTFCFVNLDMDLFQPMLAALDFFWNKMSRGGVILLHDYFHNELPGVSSAVEEFEKKINRNVNKITIGDFCSIALIKD